MNKIADRPVKRQNSPPDRGRAIGAILIEQGRLNSQDVEEIQRFANSHGVRFGEAAVQLKRITEHDIESAIAQQYNYPVLARGGENGVADDVIAAYMPQSEAVEPLRALRSQLILRWFNNANRRVLAVTSAERGEGRSWLAANLATMFAQLGERTLLIDADMRHPRQHRIFNIDNSVGLSALLTGRAGREIARRIHSQLRLFVLPAGIIPPNPQELLARPVFDVILDHFAAQFSLVILDTPAVSETADAQILAANAGHAVMMARRNHTQQANLAAAMEMLTDTGVNVIGSVINEH
ncbi:MAG TPA: chain length determinant protein tyrosine kinase EpsG [Steroidobacteraceae bacterium]|jgi:chain length determinant protein tyrosine kinase EpsG|nr:chain length determinant protein tyrosine kinase EpsG [Steroidobacteraceae bacterium]